jgi:NitT/TauT family transport system permease protein/putative hydroxymethylpyrimidine transport system permease protein
MRRWLLPALLLAALVGAWQLAASTGVLADALNLSPLLVPSPAEVAESLWHNRTLLAENSWITLKEIFLGLGLAFAVGGVLAVAMHLSDILRDSFHPLLVTSQAIPILVLAPIFVVWFGYGIWPKAVIIAIVCFFPIAVNVLAGLRSVNPDAIKMMRALDASRWQVLRRVEMPAALPYFFTGARITVAISAIAAIFGEWAGANSGLGVLIRQDSALLQTSRLFAEVTLISLMAILLFGLVALIEHRVVTWR